MKKIAQILRRSKTTVLAVVLALTLVGGSTALAATGGNFILGQLNTATTISQVSAPIIGPALRIWNTSTAAGATALDLRVAAGKPPMTVNSNAKVANLNADLLDGKDSTQLAPILRAQDDPDNPGSSVTGTNPVNNVAISAPTDGVLMISGTAYVNNYETSGVDYILNPKVDGSNATQPGWGSYFSSFPNGEGGGADGCCGQLSYTVSVPVKAGSHTVTQELGAYGGSGVKYFFNNNHLSVMFVPSSQASVASASAATEAKDSGASPNGEKK